MVYTRQGMGKYTPVNPSAFAQYRPVNPPAFAADATSPTSAAMVGAVWSHYVMPGIVVGVSVYVITKLLDSWLFRRNDS